KFNILPSRLQHRESGSFLTRKHAIRNIYYRSILCELERDTDQIRQQLSELSLYSHNFREIVAGHRSFCLCYKKRQFRFNLFYYLVEIYFCEFGNCRQPGERQHISHKGRHALRFVANFCEIFPASLFIVDVFRERSEGLNFSQWLLKVVRGDISKLLEIVI